MHHSSLNLRCVVFAAFVAVFFAVSPTTASAQAPTAPVSIAAQNGTQSNTQSNTPSARDVRLAKVDFRDVPLSDACRLLADQTGLNLAPSENARAQLVSLYLRDVSAMAAVEGLCRSHQLWYQVDRDSGIVRIHTVQEYRRDLGALQEEQTEYFTLLHPNALDVGYAIENLFGGRVELGTDDSDSDVMMDLSDRLNRFDLFARRTQGIGTNQGNGSYAGNYGSNYGTDGGQAVGMYDSANRSTRRSSRTTDVEGGVNVAPAPQPTDLGPEGIQELESRLRDGGGSNADRSARAVSYTQQGRAPIHVSIARRQNKLIVRTADVRALNEIRTLVEKLDVPTALVLLEVRVLSVDLTDGQTSFFDYQFTKGNVAGAFSNGNIASQTPPPLGPGGSGLRAGDLVFQFVDSAFGARMQLLERDNRIRSIASPLLLTANNEVSRLFVGREVPLNRGFSGGTVVANQTTTNTVTGSTAIEFRPVGTTLLITPNINADRTVTLRIVQETSNTDSTATVLVPSQTGFAPQTVTVVSSQTVSGTIVAKSDLAVVFGGLIEDGITQEKEQVPILGDVPWLGVLFQRKNDVKTRREIVIMVRPFVLSTPTESEESSRRLLERLGSGAATLDGAHPWSADRPATSTMPTERPRWSVHGFDGEEQ